MNPLKTITTIFCVVLCVFYTLKAQDKGESNIQLAIFGDPGISGCYGDYPSEYNSTLEFSFSAGVRVRINEALGSNALLAFDFGFLDVAYRGTGSKGLPVSPGTGPGPGRHRC